MANEVVIHVREQGTAQTQQALKGLQGVAFGVGAAIGGALVVAAVKGGAALVGMASDAVKSAEDLIRVQTQTNAVLKSTDGISGMSAAGIRELAASMETLTGVDEIAIQTGANMLLTFTNIGRDIFPDTTKAIVDMATAMNGGLTPSAEQLSQTAIQVGKALNDPIAGVTALQRVGVKLTEQQKDLVESLVTTGRGAEAQALILKELQTEFGGSAEAASKARGGVDQARDAFEDAQRDLVTGLIPSIQALKVAFYDAAAGILGSDGLRDALRIAMEVIAGLTRAVQDFNGDWGKAWGELPDPVLESVQEIVSNLTPLLVGLNAIGASFRAIGTGASVWRHMLKGNFEAAAAESDRLNRIMSEGVKGGSDNPWVKGIMDALNDARISARARDAIDPAKIMARGGVSGAVAAGLGAQLAAGASVFGAGGANNFNLGGDNMAKDATAKMSEWQQNMNGILDEFMHKQVEAYMKGGDAAVEVVKKQQQATLNEIVSKAVEFHQHLGINLPDALKLAAEAAQMAIEAEQELARQRMSLFQATTQNLGGGNIALLNAIATGTLQEGVTYGTPGSGADVGGVGMTNYGTVNNVYPNVTAGAMAVPSTADGMVG